MLAERLRKALDVLGSDPHAGRTLRKQAAYYLGEAVDDDALEYLNQTARTVYSHTATQAQMANFTEEMAHNAAVCNCLIVGMALGKRLGIEDGEAFARGVGNVD